MALWLSLALLAAILQMNKACWGWFSIPVSLPTVISTYFIREPLRPRPEQDRTTFCPGFKYQVQIPTKVTRTRRSTISCNGTMQLTIMQEISISGRMVIFTFPWEMRVERTVNLETHRRLIRTFSRQLC